MRCDSLAISQADSPGGDLVQVSADVIRFGEPFCWVPEPRVPRICQEEDPEIFEDDAWIVWGGEILHAMVGCHGVCHGGAMVCEQS